MKRIIYQNETFVDVPDESAWEYENDPDYERTEEAPNWPDEIAE